jgi:hypothetical protein
MHYSEISDIGLEPAKTFKNFLINSQRIIYAAVG